MSKYRIDPEARRDLAEIVTHIRRDNPTAAERFLDHVHDRFSRLAENPQMGEQRPELAVGLRMFSFGSYVIFFRHHRGRVEIARVIHGARDIDAAFRGQSS